MITPLNRDLLCQLDIIRGSDEPEITTLYQNALEKFNLKIVDYLTLRDLMTYSGCSDLALHSLLLVLFQVLNEGSPCIDFESQNFSRNLKLLYNRNVSALITEIKTKVEQQAYSRIISTQPDDFCPLIKYKSFLYFQKYFHHERKLHKHLREFVRTSIPLPTPSQVEQTKNILSDVLETTPLSKNGQVICFNNEQKNALALSMLTNLVIISGGPGTGKTAIVLTLLRCFMRQGIALEQIKLAAPTGRAAQRITESIQENLLSVLGSGIDQQLTTLEAQTIHRLLRYNPSRNGFLYHAHHKLPLSVLIVDEVSMVDIMLMSHLLQALPADAVLILLGDKNQLPSVEAGTIMAHLIPNKVTHFSESMIQILEQLFPEGEFPLTEHAHPLRDRIILLHQSYRSERTICELAEAISQLDRTPGAAQTIVDLIPLLKPHHLPLVLETHSIPRETRTSRPDEQLMSTLKEDKRCWRIQQTGESADVLKQVLAAWSHHQLRDPKPLQESYRSLLDQVNLQLDNSTEVSESGHEVLRLLFQKIASQRVLTVTRTGPWGCIHCNHILHQRIKLQCDPLGHHLYFHGMPILITENDYRKNLFNGEIGLALRIKDGEYRAFFQKFKRFISLPMAHLPSFEPAFAMTIHKSQGAEYDTVLFVMPDEPDHPLLSREIVYTAFTRAKSSILIFDPQNTLGVALNRKIIRQTGLSIWSDD